MMEFKNRNLTLRFADAYLWIEDGAQTSIAMSRHERKEAAKFLIYTKMDFNVSYSNQQISDSLKLHAEIDEDCFNFFIDVESKTRIIINVDLSRIEELEEFFRKGAEDESQKEYKEIRRGAA